MTTAKCRVRQLLRLDKLAAKDARHALLGVIEGEDEVARELAQDALDELEFANGSNMLLVDIGLESEEEALLDEEFEQEDFDFEEEDDGPGDFLDDGAVRPRRN